MDGQVNRASGHAVPILVACLIALGCSGCRTDRETVHRELFAAADTDHDSFVSATEFVASQLPDHTATESEKEFATADENRDQRLAYEEFVTTVRKSHRLLWAI